MPGFDRQAGHAIAVRVQEDGVADETVGRILTRRGEAEVLVKVVAAASIALAVAVLIGYR